MSHKPTLLDAKTDIIRSIMSTYSKEGLSDGNYKHFMDSALATFSRLNLDKRSRKLIDIQIRKSKDIKKGIEKVREDLLLILSMI